MNLYIGADVIKPVSVVRDLGVFLDSELSMHHHINTVVRSCFFHLRRLKSVRRILGAEVTSGLVSAFVTTRLDYCNSLYLNLPAYQLARLQLVQNNLARVVCKIPKHHHITPHLRSCIGSKFPQRIHYKLLSHFHPSPTPAAIISPLTNQLPICMFHPVIINPNTPSSSNCQS